MITNLKPYPAYKDSELPWLGHVPEHWGQRRMKFLFKERTQKGFPSEPLLAATQSKGVVLKEDYGSRTVTAVSGLENLKLVEVGDFVISLRSFQGGIEISHARGIISPAYTVLCPRAGFEPGYFQAYFKSSDFVSSLGLFVTGIREGQNVDYERLSRAFLPLPPPSEQAAIVRFLDWANGRLERAIRAKRKIIALLNEQKQAIIHQAVTRGLDPSVRLKPSGIPWLGEIPEHWEVVPSKSLFKHRKEKARFGDELLTASQSHGIISRQAFMEREGRRVMHVFIGSDILKHIEPNDFVMSMRSFEGGLEWSKVGGCVSSAYVALIPAPAVHCPFFAYALKSKSYISDLRRTSDLVRDGQALRYANFGQVALPLIPLPEQASIATHLDSTMSGLHSTISRLEREITLLREYRTRLVADVVTGKLDVREAAAGLPAEEAIDTSEDAADFIDEVETIDEEITE